MSDPKLRHDPGLSAPRGGLKEWFESRVLPLFAKRTARVRDLIPEWYLHGLAQGDFDLALRGLLGEEAALSASTVSRLKEKWHSELEVWQSRSLDALAVVYVAGTSATCEVVSSTPLRVSSRNPGDKTNLALSRPA